MATNNVATNFVTNSIITLTSAGQTFQIMNTSKPVIIDGGTNNIIIDGSSLTRLFHVYPGATLTLNNLQLLNGIAVGGGAIFNEGTLIISNCIISGNAATNINGVNGTTNTSGGDGGNANNGGSAYGGAIYSTGPLLSVYYSVLGTNSASGGAGGNGGNGGGGVLFGGNGGTGGTGGNAYGGAIYSLGGKNIFFADEFIGNECTAAPGGAGGAAGSGPFAGSSGQGGSGGSGGGGGLYITGNLSMSNCLFYLNSVAAGASASAQVVFTGSGPNGNTGGSAAGGGLLVTGAAASNYIENAVFFNNSCAGGSGGSASAQGSTGGNGGSAIGGGLMSGAAHTTVRACTMATNTLAGGTNGVGAGGSGSYGATGGWDIYRSAGVVSVSDSIVSGGTNQTPNYRPNLGGVSDGGYNICSDATLALATSTSRNNTDANLNSDLDSDGGPNLGPADVSGPPMLTLELLVGARAGQFIPGIPGISFPATDERLLPRTSPASAGAFELNTVTTLYTNEPPTITIQPQSQTNGVGTIALFMVEATNYFEITNVVTNSVTNISFTTNLGVFTNSGIFVTNPVTTNITTTNEIDTTVDDVTNFPGYQWQLNGVDLRDNANYFGVNSNVLTVRNISFADAGAYRVIVGVSTLEGLTISSNAVLTVRITPTVAITSPGPNTRTTSTLIKGTASGVPSNASITNIIVSISNVDSETVISGNAAIVTKGLTATWTFSTNFPPGTNIITAQSVDHSGTPSSIVTEKFFYIQTAKLTLSTNGSGSVKGRASIPGNVAPANGAMLNIGESYTLTATPAKNNIFANWTFLTNGEFDFTTNSSTVHFVMEDGLNIVAAFIPNPFDGLTGAYNGLFFNTNTNNGVTEETAGMLGPLTLNSQGAYTAKLHLDGGVYSFSGSFDSSGNSTKVVVVPEARGGPVMVSMTLDFIAGVINGSISNLDNGWDSTLFAEAAATTNSSGEYDLLLEPEPTNNIIGDGYLLLTNHLGHLVLSGALADGAAISIAPPLGRYGDIPVFESLYGNTGLLFGWLTISNGVVQTPSIFAWIKQSADLYNDLSVVASGWTNPPPSDLLTNGFLVISNATIYSSGPVSIVKDKIVGSGGISLLSGSINPRTGLMTITFGNGVGKSTTTGHAAFLEDSGIGGGYFLYKGQPGAIWLTNQSP
ncbi:MAG TPA: hypothetical protein VH595_20225 [Verrucomicrobiae bacterium]|nr:hypothetical protein [Verrucomicrobiae bacterium]